MKGKHWPRLAVVLIALALVAAACGDSDDTTTTAAAAATTTTEAMAEVPGLVEDGKLIVVTTGNFPPFTLINVDTGDNEGYSIDLAIASVVVGGDDAARSRGEGACRRHAATRRRSAHRHPVTVQGWRLRLVAMLERDAVPPTGTASTGQ